MREIGFRVAAGPFEGMRYVEEAFCSQLWPKLLGTYEREIYPSLMQLAARAHLIVVVGAAEGYYAAGLARAFPTAGMVAFEEDERAATLMRSLLYLNGLSTRARLQGRCTPAGLQRTLEEAERCFVLVDVDGGELELIDPAAVPALRSASLIVEVHEYIHPHIVETLKARMESSHEVTEFAQSARRLSDLPFRPSIAQVLLRSFTIRHLLEEHRPAIQAWLVMRPIR